VFEPPFLLRLVAGIRHGSLARARSGLERVLGVRLKLGHDLDLGDAHYAYDPRPVPPRGLVGALVQVNDIPAHGLSYVDHPDADSILATDWIGDNLLDLGRLHDALRRGFGRNYMAIEYSAVKLPPSNENRAANEIHCVRFAVTDNEFCPPLHKAPVQGCTLEFIVAPPDRQEVEARLANPDRWLGMSSGVVWDWQADGPLTRLRATFLSPSLMELGCCGRVVEARSNGAASAAGYQIQGDLLRDGTEICIKHTLSSAERRWPAWQSQGPVNRTSVFNKT
jgi:hypothetical protein